MMRRRGGRGVLSTMATTAVVVGTANAVTAKQQQRHMGKVAEQQQVAANQQAAVQSQEQLASLQQQVDSMQAHQGAAAAPAGDNVMAQLQQLSTMQAAGLLTAEQFEAAKNKLLGI